jgi:UDP-N-acetylmuramate dehydrogenase
VKETEQQLKKEFPQMESAVPLAQFSSMGIGGPADLFYKLEKIEDAQPLISKTRELGIPFVIIGGGTNVIFADGGFKGLVIRMEARKINLGNDSSSAASICAEAGAGLAQVIQFALKNNLTGLEKMTGIPGTIGGAVRGNAGAFGTEIKNVFQKALVLTKKNELTEVGPEYLQFSYRQSVIKQSKDIILKVWLSLQKDEKAAKKAQEEAKIIITERIAKQPKGQCTGSFFKNPSPDLSAGYLLDKSGCKGLQVGGAQVSPEHANWIMNRGNARQKDVMELSKILKERVLHHFNIRLEREVQLIGETGFLVD